MKTLALLLIAATNAAAIEMPNCGAPIQKAINGFNGDPEVNCGFSIDEMIAVQKLKDGYLATTNPEYGPDVSREFIFIRTNEALEKGQRLAGNVTYIEPVKYQALDGFERTVYEFAPVPIPAADPRSATAAMPAVDPAVAKKLAELQ